MYFKAVFLSSNTRDTGFSPKLKPCCRGIPLSHLRPDEVLSVHVNKHRCQWIVAVPSVCWASAAGGHVSTGKSFEGRLQGGVTGVHSSNGVLHPNKQGQGFAPVLSGVGHHCPDTPIFIKASK
ncbi:hypothetical protein NQZ68_001574 [Dissostichus eleginoides]|nr:hypothetical protein NQZ68_001574 [Dissostichus eleginoides]